MILVFFSPATLFTMQVYSPVSNMLIGVIFSNAPVPITRLFLLQVTDTSGLADVAQDILNCSPLIILLAAVVIFGTSKSKTFKG